MTISKESLESFKDLWKEKFNETISDAVATEKANKLIGVVELIYKSMTEKEFQIVQERRKQTGDI